MKKRTDVGKGIIPRVYQKPALLFEDAFVVLCDFGDQTFTHYVSQKNHREQQEIFDMFMLLRKKILAHFSQESK